jgi:hypothetical protein
MKKLAIFILKVLTIALVAIPVASSASQTSAAAPVTEIDIQINAGGQVIFYLSGTRSGMPACATTGNRWTFNGASAAGQAALSSIMTAYASGKQVMVYGTGVCDVWADTETVNYIQF